MPRRLKKVKAKSRRKVVARRKAPLMKSIYPFIRHTSVNTMAQFNTTYSVGGFTKKDGYVIPTTTAAISNPAWYPFTIAFTISDVPNYTEFTNLFDEYKISGVRLRLTPIPTDTSSPNAPGTSPTGGIIHLVNDYDDNALPAASEAGVDEMRQYPNYKTFNLATNRTLTRFIKPRVSLGVVGSGGLNQYGSLNPWIDCSSLNVLHYGIKGIIELYQLNANLNYYPICGLHV